MIIIENTKLSDCSMSLMVQFSDKELVQDGV